VGVGALCWCGLWFGLRASGRARAILWTIGLARLGPFILMLLWSMVSRLLLSGFVGPGSVVWLMGLLPQALDLALFAGLIGLARSQLRREMAGAEPLLLGNILPRLSANSRALIDLARSWPRVE